MGISSVSPTQASPIHPPIQLAQKTSASTHHSFVAKAVRQVGEAVVLIDTERTISRQIDPFFDDPFFRRFFGDDFLFQPPQERRLRGQGSGFIVESKGIILTNSHVVNNADRVTVILRDGRTFDGKVLGADPVTDLAVVKIEGENFPTATLGDSAQIQVGDWAIAVGNPLGLDNTVTLGIVSTLNRSSAQVGIPDKRLDFIQTDAAINPGNSGGPLLNEDGEVIGINTAIRPGAMGIGFAIPINTAKVIYPVLALGEKVVHPYLGIRMVNLTPQLAATNNQDPNSSLQLPEVIGVLVMQVEPNSPAAAAGIKSGDVIVEFNGQKVVDAEQLQRLVENSQVNKSIPLRIRRTQETKTITIRPGELQELS
ncbi:MAG: HhoA/HhoB/HtrA family serine endopeptidase [Oscillatoria sp. PMC 1068.18]|nr:HhoA/HhoB/HtrA family serine endopeptidase [Oscillatoria sp. PMC 1076.18]MEC4988504.1 HhoA/HhoB/HtrA family serine endopeptidase [Oscillatoria sp. PMC 1068.18]